MKDLYALLKIKPQSTQARVLAALRQDGSLSEADRRAVELILLNPNRRRQYDRVRHTMRQIALLRSVLGMELGTQSHRGVYFNFIPQTPKSSSASIPKPPPQSTFNSGGGEKHTWPASRATGRRMPGVAILVIGILLGISYLALQDASRTDEPLQRVGSVSPTPAQTKAVFDQPIQPLPVTGAYDTSHSATRNAIIVRTRGDRHTLVKIERLDGGDVTRGFIRAGGAHTFRLPMGTYTLKAASGKTWYGEQHYFGPDTIFTKADDTFPLVSNGEQWTVELIPQKAGNLREIRLRPDQF